MATPTTMVHVRVKRQVKAKATKALDEMGVSMSTVLRYLINYVAKQKALPFRLEVPNAKTAAAIEEARQGSLPSFDSVSDLMTDLNAPD